MGKMQKGASPVKGGGGSAPKGGMQPTQKAPTNKGPRSARIAKSAPTKGSGSDTNPFSSARKSR